jgi:hypothetical protein
MKPRVVSKLLLVFILLICGALGGGLRRSFTS